MNRPSRPARSSRPSRLLACAVTAGVLLSAAACTGEAGGGRAAKGDGDGGPGHRAAASPATGQSPTASASASPALTDAQARAALINGADLGEQWSATQGGATWRDGLLKSTTAAADADPDCGRLLDGVYTEELLGEPKGVRAATGFDDADNQGQLHYQVAAYSQADVDAKLAWLKTLPAKCARFTATDVRGGRQSVQVAPVALPGTGDGREGLRLTITGTAADTDGDTPMLTLDVAAVRVGDHAVLVTNGGLAGAEEDATQRAVELGAPRLQDAIAGRASAQQPTRPPVESTRPPVQPVQPPAEPDDEADYEDG
ncbi:hypothetical protein [Streptomyces sp. NPDC005485]|uniref:hypothetical protein n=1 Tax=Streptomyces sp. NPDC005485 TaxID=3155591 RepID=UPI0033B28C16